MATRRVILKVKKPFAKGKGLGSGADMKRHLNNLLPADHLACLHSGGFLLGPPSVSHGKEAKHRDWIRRMVQKWSAELAVKSRRTNDGFKIILRLVPDAVNDLTFSKHSTTQALLGIWEKAIELFRLRRGWTAPAGELGWICGGLDDSGGAHLHVILFPTSKDGHPLHAGADGEEGHLAEISAMANLAAEIYWRDYLGAAYQDPDYRKSISTIPIFEPPLPSHGYLVNGKFVVKCRKSNLGETPKINTALIARDMLSDTMISLNIGSPLMRPDHKGIIRLQSLVAIKMVFNDSQWLFPILYKKRTPSQIIEIQEKLPDEYLMIKALIEELGRSGHLPTRRLVDKIAQSEVESTFVALYLSVGIQGQQTNETTLKIGKNLAGSYQKYIQSLSAEKIGAILKIRDKIKTGALKTKLRACSYRSALRSIAPNNSDSRTACILLALIRGAERIGHFLDSMYDEINTGINYAGTNGSVNIQKLEWSIDNGQMVRNNALGAPWPPHFDPLNVFVPLMSQEPKTFEQTLDEAELSEAVQSRYAANPGALSRMIRITQSKEIQRQQRIRECIRVNPQV